MDQEQFPANSYRIKETKVTKAEPREKVEKVIIGEVIQRKKPLHTRIIAFFIGGDAKSVRDYVLLDVIGPSIKDMIVDTVIQGTERTFYNDGRRGGGRGIGRGIGRVGGGYTSYDRFSAPGRVSGYGGGRGREPAREIGRPPRSVRDLGEIILETRVEAEEVIGRLVYYISKYDSVTLADLGEMLGITGDFTDVKYGWTDLKDADIRRARGGGYILLLPPPEPLD